MYVSGNRTMAKDPKNLKVILCERPEFPKTSIMGTIGPACFCPLKGIDLIPQMISNGMNMVRINLAHVHGEKERSDVVTLLDRLDNYMSSCNEPVIVTVDLAGPKIRVAERLRHWVNNDPVPGIPLKDGDRITLTLDEDYGVRSNTWGQKDTKISLDTGSAQVHFDVLSSGDRVSMADGCLQLEVTGVGTGEVECEVKNDWILESKKGVNFPGLAVTRSALTRKDYDDLKWLFDPAKGVSQGRVDYISLSFVKSRLDLDILKNYISANFDCTNLRVISKIETSDSVADPQDDYQVFRQILEASDGIMIARGDLGAEIPFEDVPEIQRRLIELTHEARKPVIVATQMLEFMVKHDFATRAEVTDVTNAILEGADITMLSEETSNGKDPVASVRTMQKIAKRACARVSPLPVNPEEGPHPNARKIIGAMAHPVVEFAEGVGATRIVCFTHSGETAIAIAHYRPRQPVVAVTYNADAVVKLAPYRGIYVVYINYIPRDPVEHRDVCRRLLQAELRMAQSGELSVVTMSMDPSQASTRETNALYVLVH